MQKINAGLKVYAVLKAVSGDNTYYIDSINDLNDALKKGDVSLWFMYNTKTMEVAYAYIVTPAG